MTDTNQPRRRKTTGKDTPRLRHGVMKRGNTWSYVIRVKDPETGVSKPRWVGGFATEEAAKSARDESRVKARRGEYVDRGGWQQRVAGGSVREARVRAQDPLLRGAKPGQLRRRTGDVAQIHRLGGQALHQPDHRMDHRPQPDQPTLVMTHRPRPPRDRTLSGAPRGTGRLSTARDGG